VNVDEFGGRIMSEKMINSLWTPEVFAIHQPMKWKSSRLDEKDQKEKRRGESIDY